MEIILYTLLMFFSVVGICDIIHCIHIHTIKPNKSLKKVLVCKLDNEDFEAQINYLFEQYKWYGTKCFDKFICVCDEKRVNTADIDCYEEFFFIDDKDIHKLYEKLGSEN